MTMEFQYDVFLSHSTKDKAVVRLLAERLQVAVRKHLKVWPVPPKRLREGGSDEWVLLPSLAGAGAGGRRPSEGRGASDSIPAKIDPPPLRSYGETGEGLEQSRVLARPAEAPARRRTCLAEASE